MGEIGNSDMVEMLINVYRYTLKQKNTYKEV